MVMGRRGQRWWSEGIRFQCQGSGKCCVSRGEYGFVYVTAEDRRRMASFFGIRTSSFTRLYCQRDENDQYYLQDFTDACRFLEANRCAVYDARPTQCRTWPFWPENMDARRWSSEVASFCPGVGKGRVWSEEAIQEVLTAEILAQEQTG